MHALDSTFLAVRPLHRDFPVDELKRDALLFDRLLVPNLDVVLGLHADSGARAELEWLEKHGVITSDLEGQVMSSPTKWTWGMGDPKAVDPLAKIQFISNVSMATDRGGGKSRILDLHARAVASALYVNHHTVAVPILSATPEAIDNTCVQFLDQNRNITEQTAFALSEITGTDLLTYKTDILQIAISRMPVPSESTAWERLIEFRRDSDAKAKLFLFRRWLRKMAKEDVPGEEVREELEYLIHEYEQHMRVHRMSINKSVLETVVTTVGEAAEDLVKFKWGQMAKLPFAVKQRKIDLLKAEREAPGREVAYVSHVRRTFGE